MRPTRLLLISCLLVLGLAMIVADIFLAQASMTDIRQIGDSLKGFTQVTAVLAFLVAVCFFIFSGLGYITSLNHPIASRTAKQAIIVAGFGSAITIGAFALTGIINDMTIKTFGL